APAPTYWNKRIRPERRAIDVFDPNSGDYDKLRKLGFTSALLSPESGILRGTCDVVTLADGGFEDRLLNESVAQSLAWERGRYQDYPNSQMGVIALIRQSLYDAQWYDNAWTMYRRNPKQDAPEKNFALEALQDVLKGDEPVLVDSNTLHHGWQADAIADEFDLKLWRLGNGREYQYLDQYKNNKTPLILPLNFPKAPRVETYEETLDIRLTALRHWDWAPSNPAKLDEAGVKFCLTTSRMDASDFYANLRQAIERGLSEETALAALTTRPAALLGIDKQLGTLQKGKRAHFVITDGCLFEKETKIHEVWIDGQQHVYYRPPQAEPAGAWDIAIAQAAGLPDSLTMELSGDAPKISGSIYQGTDEIKFEFKELDGQRIAFSFNAKKLNATGVYQFSGTVRNEDISGFGVTPKGASFQWSASKKDQEDKEKTKNKDDEDEKTWTPLGRIVYPPNAYGRESLPEQPKHVFVHNATIWTCGPDGILENADMLVTNGKVAKVGKNLTPPKSAVIINAEGKHVSPGLIDAHSHIATESVNEVGQEITAEVRINDVIECDDSSIYRQLAGGLTMSHILHGSANAIGGQCAQIKMRWGQTPDKIKFEHAFPSIKFALGENPKRVWADKYPHSRMGVEQIMRDRFLAAKDYQYALAHTKRNEIPPHRDLELDALVEVLNGERIVHCHSYRQDEILALMRTAEDLGFQICTFTHILEGYKVADIMKQHGAMGSTFSDWWAYKFEVFDAIPYNAAIMYEQGIVVSMNSDDAELARRLNTEAAKGMKYGGVPEEEALKFVTINSAKQMKIDSYVGSLETGKDADFVIWNGPPMSSYSVCQQTWIDGCKYFD
ncbi:amidohydrolase family protein, partial [bacterium]|nr:amidohydrolase family protein [bacterium]